MSDQLLGAADSWAVEDGGEARPGESPVPLASVPDGPLGVSFNIPPNRTGITCLPAPEEPWLVFRGCREGPGEEQGAGSDVA